MGSCCSACAQGAGSCEGGGCAVTRGVAVPAEYLAVGGYGLAGGYDYDVAPFYAPAGHGQTITLPAGATGSHPGGLTDAQWNGLTPEQQTALVKSEIETGAATTAQIGQWITAAGTGIVEIIKAAFALEAAKASTTAERQSIIQKGNAAVDAALANTGNTTTSTPTTNPTPAATGLTSNQLLGIGAGVIGVGLLVWLAMRPRKNPNNEPQAHAPPRPEYIDAEGWVEPTSTTFHRGRTGSSSTFHRGGNRAIAPPRDPRTGRFLPAGAR
jgi:hypothetical protein